MINKKCKSRTHPCNDIISYSLASHLNHLLIKVSAVSGKRKMKCYADTAGWKWNWIQLLFHSSSNEPRNPEKEEGRGGTFFVVAASALLHSSS